VIGPALREHVKTYKLSQNIEDQLIWKTKAKRA